MDRLGCAGPVASPSRKAASLSRRASTGGAAPVVLGFSAAKRCSRSDLWSFVSRASRAPTVGAASDESIPGAGGSGGPDSAGGRGAGCLGGSGGGTAGDRRRRCASSASKRPAPRSRKVSVFGSTHACRAASYAATSAISTRTTSEPSSLIRTSAFGLPPSRTTAPPSTSSSPTLRQ